MKAFIASIVNLFSEDKPAAVAPAKVSWETRKRMANKAIDRALLKVHNASRASVMAKIDIAARLRSQVEESYTKHSEAKFEMTMGLIRSFDRVGY